MYIRQLRSFLYFFGIILFILTLDSCITRKKASLREMMQKFKSELNGDNKPLDTAYKPSLELTKKLDPKKEEEKKKKINAKTFYGFKTMRRFTRKGKDPKNREYEIFFVLKKFYAPDPLIKDIYWYYSKKRTIVTGDVSKFDKKYLKPMHGPYLRKIGKKVMEEGIYYVGTKHGRWMKYDRNYILLDKKRYYKGYATDAEITYYDEEKKKVKEVIPFQLGKMDGEYSYYAEDGTLLTYGLYKDGIKVGIWTEYHPNKKKKRETQYVKEKDPYQNFTPYIIREYNEKGKPVYDFRKDAVKDSTNLNKN
jgi:antitoxin component YwqK of YwqJK toxin-antitoxin module